MNASSFQVMSAVCRWMAACLLWILMPYASGADPVFTDADIREFFDRIIVERLDAKVSAKERERIQRLPAATKAAMAGFLVLEHEFATEQRYWQGVEKDEAEEKAEAEARSGGSDRTPPKPKLKPKPPPSPEVIARDLAAAAVRLEWLRPTAEDTRGWHQAYATRHERFFAEREWDLLRFISGTSAAPGPGFTIRFPASITRSATHAALARLPHDRLDWGMLDARLRGELSATLLDLRRILQAAPVRPHEVLGTANWIRIAELIPESPVRRLMLAPDAVMARHHHALYQAAASQAAIERERAAQRQREAETAFQRTQAELAALTRPPAVGTTYLSATLSRPNATARRALRIPVREEPLLRHALIPEARR